MSDDQNPQYLTDAAKAANAAIASGDQKGYEDIMGAFERNVDIEKAKKDMGRK